jgi:hypothetical protein
LDLTPLRLALSGEKKGERRGVAGGKYAHAIHREGGLSYIRIRKINITAILMDAPMETSESDKAA